MYLVQVSYMYGPKSSISTVAIRLMISMLHKLKADVYSAWDRWRLQNLHLYLIRLST